MEVFDAVRTVLAARNYQDKPVPSEIVRRIVEAGRLTGSSMNRQPWHFIVVEKPRYAAAAGRTGENRTLYRAGTAGDCRSD
jgi:nitroreductase